MGKDGVFDALHLSVESFAASTVLHFHSQITIVELQLRLNKFGY